MARRAVALLTGITAVVLFLLEYVFAIWPSLHVTRVYATIRGYRRHRGLRPRARKVAIRREVKSAAAHWYAWWGAHLWSWTRPLLGIKCSIDFTLLDTPSPPLVLISNHQNTLDALILIWLIH